MIETMRETWMRSDEKDVTASFQKKEDTMMATIWNRCHPLICLHENSNEEDMR